MKYATSLMDWTRILAQAQVPEPPGFQDTVKAIEAQPYKKPVKKPKKR